MTPGELLQLFDATVIVILFGEAAYLVGEYIVKRFTRKREDEKVIR